MKQFILDRFEGSYAVCEQEDGSMIDIEKSLLPADSKEGDCLNLLENGTFEIDHIRTKQRLDEAKKLMDSLFE